MLIHKILVEKNDFSQEFYRCCRDYQSLQIACAWGGDPGKVTPFEYLIKVQGSMKVILGVSFNHTHPDIIKYLKNIGASVRIFSSTGESSLFHPKIYLFRSGDRIALFLGSSNLTYCGFYENHEANVLLEGIPEKEEIKQIVELQNKFNEWSSSKYSFIPGETWLTKYREEYETIKKIQSQSKMRTPVQHEEGISSASWLRTSGWDMYYRKVLNELPKRHNQGKGYFIVLDKVKQLLPAPWDAEIFNDIEKRQLIGGMYRGNYDYGAFGHVAASGHFRHLMAKGTASQKELISKLINRISAMAVPLDYEEIEDSLRKLVKLNCSMKVWGRLLCITRPDLFCTVSSKSVRENIGKILNIPQSEFEEPKGYVKLLKLIHSSPWYNSDKPSNENQQLIWKNRVAMLDAVLYDE